MYAGNTLASTCTHTIIYIYRLSNPISCGVFGESYMIGVRLGRPGSTCPFPFFHGKWVQLFPGHSPFISTMEISFELLSANSRAGSGLTAGPTVPFWGQPGRSRWRLCSGALLQIWMETQKPRSSQARGTAPHFPPAPHKAV